MRSVHKKCREQRKKYPHKKEEKNGKRILQSEVMSEDTALKDSFLLSGIRKIDTLDSSISTRR